MMTSAQVVETSVNVTSNSPSQDYTQPDDHNLPNYNINIIHIFYIVTVRTTFVRLTAALDSPGWQTLFQVTL